MVYLLLTTSYKFIMIDIFDNTIHLFQDDSLTYPDSSYSFSPSESYPEYPFNDISEAPNLIYKNMRQLFYQMKLDIEHYGSPLWNPFGDFIKSGDQVLIKPNWVLHNNRMESEGLESMVTHPSLIRVVIDYVYIALKGEGSIIIGDSPMAECDLSVLFKNGYYQVLWDYYFKMKVPIQVMDFRGSVLIKNKQIAKTDSDTGIIVNIGNESRLEELTDNQYENFVMVLGCYPDNIKNFHSRGNHKYLFNKWVLTSDVIINMPKIKTHRRVGMTACSKNYVGACLLKDCLPHSIFGGVSTGGDEYPTSDLFSKLYSKLKKYQLRKAINTKITRKLRRVLSMQSKRVSPDNNNHWDGCWHGNNVIWRFVVDLNIGVLFANKEGKLTKTPQRTIFNICDGVIAGQGNGPISPCEKKLGSIICGFNGTTIDYFIARIMGFKPHLIKYIPVLLEMEKIDPNNLMVITEKRKLLINNYPFRDDMNFIPPDGWKNYLEAK